MRIFGVEPEAGDDGRQSLAKRGDRAHRHPRHHRRRRPDPAPRRHRLPDPAARGRRGHDRERRRAGGDHAGLRGDVARPWSSRPGAWAWRRFGRWPGGCPGSASGWWSAAATSTSTGTPRCSRGAPPVRQQSHFQDRIGPESGFAVTPPSPRSAQPGEWLGVEPRLQQVRHVLSGQRDELLGGHRAVPVPRRPVAQQREERARRRSGRAGRAGSARRACRRARRTAARRRGRPAPGRRAGRAIDGVPLGARARRPSGRRTPPTTATRRTSRSPR